MKIKSLLFILIALLITGITTQADNLAMHVSVHDGLAGSSEILEGKLTVGERRTRTALRMERSTAGDSTTSAELYNNLCVAQIKRDSIKQARRTCKRAVSHAMKLVSGIGQNPQSIKRIKAAALSNRGVLNMLDGNLDRALADFNKARQLSPSLENVQLNMAAATSTKNSAGIAVVLN